MRTAVQACTPACEIALAHTCSRAGQTGVHDCMTDGPGVGWAGGTWHGLHQGMGGGRGDDRGGGKAGAPAPGQCRMRTALSEIKPEEILESELVERVEQPIEW